MKRYLSLFALFLLSAASVFAQANNPTPPAGATNSIQYNGGKKFAAVASPAGPGQFTCGFSPTNATPVLPTCPQVGLLVSQELSGSSTGITVAYSDNGNTINHDVAASGTGGITLPTATTLGNSNFGFKYCNKSPQTDVITPTTWTIAGSATLNVAQGVCYVIHTDPFSATNWLADGSSIGGAVSGVSNSDGTLTISPTTGAVVASIALGHANTWSAAQIWSALGTFSAAGAASTPGLKVTGAPYTGGSGTTNFPQFYINSGAAPTTFSTAGTAFGINAPSGFTGNLVDSYVNGGNSVWSVLYTGEALFGSGALAPTLGTSGGIFAIEGTAPTGASTNYGWYNDSTLHCFDIIDQTTNLGCAIGEASIIAANTIPKALGTTSKVGASVLSDDGATLTYTGATGLALTPPITKYNNISTVSNGVPSEYATIDLTAQTAAKTATALYTPAATGLFRVCYYGKVTTAATTSSILGGTTGLVLAYTDGTDSVAQTAFTLPSTSQAGNTVTIGTGNTTNTTQATVNGCGVMYAKTGVGITYAFGYTSVGGTPMAYELHIKIEAM